jgi:hypothetical protein
MLTEPIKQKIEDLFNSTPDYVGVAWGNKISNNQHTGERSIVFHVTKKQPLSEIPKEEHLPSTVEIDGVTYKTDVVEVGEITAFACPTTTLNNCYSWTDFYFNEYTGGPTYGGGGATPPGNRGVIRPMQGGISITSFNELGTVGTMGFLAVDNEKNALVGVTNNHVTIGDAFFTTYRTLTNSNEYQDQYYQPGESGFQGNPNYVVGEVVRYVPINPTPALNLVDGALVSIDPSKVTNAESYKLYGTSILTPMPFATTAELDNLLITNPPLASSGRTSGVKQDSPCGLKIFSVGSASAVSGYKLEGVAQNVNYTSLITFIRNSPDQTTVAECPYPIYPGDSGSALAAYIDGVWKIIGLCFAGSTYYGMACRIDNVAAQLNISAWDGTTKNYFNTGSRQYITTIGGSTDKTLTCASNIYWQVGTTSLTNPCP